MKRRSHRVPVPNKWIEKVNAYKDDHGLSLRELSRKAADSVGRANAFPVATVSRYLRHDFTTLELTEAFAALLKEPMPVIGGESPEVQAWCELGQRLEQHSPNLLRRELKELEALVDALDRYTRRNVSVK